MAILNFSLSAVGETGQTPKFIYLNTNDTFERVTTAGYLNSFVSSGQPLSESDLAVVTTRDTPNSKTAEVNIYNLSYVAKNWSLIAPSYNLKYAGKTDNGGGSTAILIMVPGCLATDIAFVTVEASTNLVQVQKVTPGSGSIEVILTGNPGASTVLGYQVLRSAS